jgi:hypothetical protein
MHEASHENVWHETRQANAGRMPGEPGVEDRAVSGTVGKCDAGRSRQTRAPATISKHLLMKSAGTGLGVIVCLPISSAVIVLGPARAALGGRRDGLVFGGRGVVCLLSHDLGKTFDALPFEDTLAQARTPSCEPSPNCEKGAGEAAQAGSGGGRRRQKGAVGGLTGRSPAAEEKRDVSARAGGYTRYPARRIVGLSEDEGCRRGCRVV